MARVPFAVNTTAGSSVTTVVPGLKESNSMPLAETGESVGKLIVTMRCWPLAGAPASN
jgi:hypothetical protein